MTNNTLGGQQTYAAVWIEVRCADGVDGSCSNRRHNAPYCRCSYLLIGGAIQCKLPQLALIIDWQGIAQQCPERVAKNVFQVHGITKDDEVVFNRPFETGAGVVLFLKARTLLDWYGGL